MGILKPRLPGYTAYKIIIYQEGARTRRVNIDAPGPEAALNFMIKAHKLTPGTRITLIDRMTNNVVCETADQGKGRPAFNISLDLIYDALKNNKTVKAAARSLGVSRAYIYKYLGPDQIKSLKNENIGNTGQAAAARNGLNRSD